MKNLFAPAPSGHACKTSTVTEISIPGTDLVFSVKSVSFKDGEIKVKTRLLNGEKVLLKDSYTLDVSHIVSGKQEKERVSHSGEDDD